MPWAQRKEKRFIPQWGWLLLGGGAKSTRQHPAFRPPKTGGALLTTLPSCTVKRRDPSLPLAGRQLPQSRDSLSGQECQLHAVKIAPSTC